MEFRETLLAAQRNQQQKSSDKTYYKARFDPPKKEQRPRDRLSDNIQKFLAKKEEEERQKQLELKRKREELHAMRDPKMLRKIQKTLKVIKSANKSVLADAVDHDHTAVTLEGPDQPDQDDYGYESQEAAAIYQKMMEKYSKIPDEPKFPVSNSSARRDIAGTRERVKHALQHDDEPVPHKRRRKGDHTEKEPSPPPIVDYDKKKEEKPDRPKVKKMAPPPMDFNQLLKLAEKKKSEPLEVQVKKVPVDSEPERPMTKKQRREYEEEMARRLRRQQRLDEAKQKPQKEERAIKEKEKEKKAEPGSFTRIPKLSDKNTNHTVVKSNNDNRKSEGKSTAEKERSEKLQRDQIERENLERIKLERDKVQLERSRLDKERLQLEIERSKLDKEKERLIRERLERTKASQDVSRSDMRPTEKYSKVKTEKTFKDKANSSASREQMTRHETSKNIDLKTQNTYRIDRNTNERKPINGHTSQANVPKQLSKESIKQKMLEKEAREKVLAKQKALFGNDSAPKANGSLKPVNNSKPVNGKSRLPDQKSLPSSSRADEKPQLKVPNHFDFDKYMKSLGKPGQKAVDKSGTRQPDGSRQFPPGDVKRKLTPDEMRRRQMLKKKAMNSDSEYDSEMDDFIDDGEEDLDYSQHIKEIFGYDKAKYVNMDDDDDPTMESSFTRQMREEYMSKKIGIMEDLEDMRQEALEKKMKSSKRRRIDD